MKFIKYSTELHYHLFALNYAFMTGILEFFCTNL
jgi:hypothetical protein